MLGVERAGVEMPQQQRAHPHANGEHDNVGVDLPVLHAESKLRHPQQHLGNQRSRRFLDQLEIRLFCLLAQGDEPRAALDPPAAAGASATPEREYNDRPQ